MSSETKQREQLMRNTEFHSYDPAEGHGLLHDPFKAIICPRPIGWISSCSADGIANLAPYSFFNAVSDRPPAVVFASDGWKHSACNIKENGCFAFNVVTKRLLTRMNQTSILHDKTIDEFKEAGIKKRQCLKIPVPCVAESPAVLECRVMHILELKAYDGQSTDYKLVIGQVVCVSIDRRYLRNGRFDFAATYPVLRAGSRGEYLQVRPENVFTLTRPAGSF